ncbi:Regulator of chromosome condensation [Toxocara canis]|uniref:Regulator of chromosome condensation n=1 Tax=Toxocara canis TaxID=6265 RepID=A0A0B2V2V8_TOXCA|nr:Regulator of chromosome condensation [Toxocara canis]
MSPRKVARKATQPVRKRKVNPKTNGSMPANGTVGTNEASEAERREEHEQPTESVPSKLVKRERSSSTAATPAKDGTAKKTTYGRKRKVPSATSRAVKTNDEVPAVAGSTGRSRKKKFHLFIESYLPREYGDRVLSCGEGEQLGHPGRTTTKKPRAIDTLPPDKKIAQVAAGGVHSLVLLEDGTVFSCGINEKGTVPAEGVEAEGSTDRLTPINFSDEIRRHGKLVMITAGASFSAGLTNRGSVIAWGNIRDTSGCIETHKLLREMEQRPVVIVRHQRKVIVKIAAGENHLAMLSENGELLTFGDGSMGQLGRLGRVSHIRAQQMVDDSGDFLRVSVLEKGKGRLVHFDDIMAGGYWTAARAEDGRVFVCGLNNFGHLGIEPPAVDQKAKPGEDSPELRIMRPTIAPAYDGHKFVQLCGVQHMIALDENGDLYGIGKNTDNALGLGTWTGNEDSEHWRYTHLEKIELPAKAMGIAAKLGCSLAWTQEGVAYSWGCDTSGQLGLGIKDDDDDKVVPKPRQIESAHLNGYRIVGASIADNHALFLAAKTSA